MSLPPLRWRSRDATIPHHRARHLVSPWSWVRHVRTHITTVTVCRSCLTRRPFGAASAVNICVNSLVLSTFVTRQTIGGGCGGRGLQIQTNDCTKQPKNKNKREQPQHNRNKKHWKIPKHSRNTRESLETRDRQPGVRNSALDTLCA